MIKKNINIGIPVYNEEKNISELVKSLINQKFNKYKLNKIIISSDGSTDGTINKLSNFKNIKLLVINNKDRKGISRGLNQIIKNSDTESLVILNGDVQIKDDFFIEKISMPILNSDADLTSCRVVEKVGNTFVEKVIVLGSKYRWAVYEKYNNGNNVYTCRGLARAFSKRLYKKIKFKESIGEDMYSYFYTKKQGFRYEYVTNTELLYKVPVGINDHKGQSTRYLKAIENMKSVFGTKFVEDNHPWPKLLFLQEGLKLFFNDPIHAIVYPFIYITMRIIFTFKKPSINNLWDIAVTSK